MPTPVSRPVSAEPPEIIVLPGDGIGPEIAEAAIRLFEAIGGIEIEQHLIGGCSIDAHGRSLTADVLERCKESDSVLLGAVGGPQWDSTVPGHPRPEDGLLELRKALGHGEGLYANLRPVKPYPALMDASPLRPERIEGTDLLIVRELTGGIYYGKSDRVEGGRRAFDTCDYTVEEIWRVAKVAFEAARERRGKLTSVDKANVMESSRLWRETIIEIAKKYPDVVVDHMLVDNAAMQLVARPSEFDVLITENTFGDILSDEAAMISGSLGMLPSASIDHYPPGLFEPIHGSAPDIAGRGVANPLGTLLSVALMFRYGLGRFKNAPKIADAIDDAVELVLDAGLRTPDLVYAGESAESDVKVVNTVEMTEAVLAALDFPEEHWTTGGISREAYERKLDKSAPKVDSRVAQPA
jgi:3-isopropylmalate dehydrogenase